MSVVSNNILAGASGQGGGGYQIERSLRFNPADSAYLNRTPSSSGNLRTWTWSGWIKRSNTGSGHTNDFFSCGVNIHNGGAGGAQANAYFDTDGTMQVYEYSGGYGYNYRTTQVFRDLSAWYHIVISLDTSNSTAGDRVKIYVNGGRVTDFSTSTAPALNFEGEINKGGVQHYISDTVAYFDGYLADIHFIDGQALAPTDFGETDDNGVWQPKEFDGTYGPLVDQSRTWSSDWTGDFYSGYGPTLAFNNDFGHGVAVEYPSNGATGRTVTINPAISGSVIRVNYARSNTSTPASINGTETLPSTGAGSTYQWHTLTATSISSVTLSHDPIGSSYITAIEVDGKLLVDSGVSVADNSFHLDFTDNSSNAALGTDTSGNSNTWTVNNLAAQTVNGVNYYNMLNVTPNVGNAFIASNVTPYVNTSTWAITDVHWIGMSYYSGTGAMTFTPTTSIPVTNSLIVYFGAWADSAYTTALTITYTDSTTETSSFTSSSQNYMGVKTASNASGKSIQSISVINSSGLGYHSIGGIVVDGNILESTVSVDGDSLLDTPTNGTQTDTGAGGEVVGNYATWNPVSKVGGGGFSEGNLVFTGNSGWSSAHATIGALTTGKWYYEMTLQGNPVNQSQGSLYAMVGWTSNPQATTAYTNTDWVALEDTGWYRNFGSQTNSSTVMSSGGVIGILVDLDANTFEFKYNNTSRVTGTIGGTAGRAMYPFITSYDASQSKMSANFGQRPFAYAAPSGYKCLCTTNLPDPTIEDGSKYFDTKLFTGNGGTQSITGYNFSPDFAWIKNRGSAQSHALFDTVRGATKGLHCDLTQAEWTDTNTLTAFNNDGFTLGGHDVTNYSSNTYVGWAWDAGSSTTTIAAGGLNSSLYTQNSVYSGGTVTGNTYSGYGWANAFDADFSNAAAGNGATNTTTIDLSSFSITASAGEIILVFNSDVSSNTYWRFNGVTPTASNTSVRSTDSGYEFTLTQATSLTGITLDGLSQLTGVFVAGKRLIDSNVSITTPSIASTVRANPSAGFSIVSYTGTGSSDTFGHGLSTAPKAVIVKKLTAASWNVYHAGIGATKTLELNGTGSEATTQSWGDTAPTNSVVTVGNYPDTNDNNGNYIAYCFAPVEGYSSVGSFVGNGSTDGPFVYTGFKVAWLLTRSTSSSRSWNIWDTARDTHNPMDANLFPNNNNAEGSDPLHNIDMLSNGFKPRTGNVDRNGNGETYIYLAFASNPFKTARAR